MLKQLVRELQRYSCKAFMPKICNSPVYIPCLKPALVLREGSNVRDVGHICNQTRCWFRNLRVIDCMRRCEDRKDQLSLLGQIQDVCRECSNVLEQVGVNEATSWSNLAVSLSHLTPVLSGRAQVPERATV